MPTEYELMTVDDYTRLCERGVYEWHSVSREPLVNTVVIVYVDTLELRGQFFAAYVGDGRFIAQLNGSELDPSHWRLNTGPNPPIAPVEYPLELD